MHKNQESKITKILYNQITFLIAVCSLAVGITLFVTRADNRFEQDIALIKQDINFIRTNEMKHIQENLEENKVFQKETRQELEEIQIILAKILERLK